MPWRRRRTSEGAVALEAALVTPILLILVLGIVEFSFAMRNYVVVVSDARVGARIAAAGANFGPADCDAPVAGDPTTEMPCVKGIAPLLASAAAKAIQDSGSAMPMENINYLYIYRANDQGFPEGGAGDFSTCPASSCVKFTWLPRLEKFRFTSGGWASTSISACFPGRTPDPLTGDKRNLERVGVYLNTTHRGITGLFFDELTLEDHAVLNFEPIQASMCGEGQHQ